MAFFEDDEDEQEQSGPLAVARAMSSDDSAAPPDAMPDTTARTQPVKEDPATSVARGSKDDGSAQVLADYPYEESDEQKSLDSSTGDSQEPTAQASSPEEASDQGLAALANQPAMKAPVRPALKPYSTGSLDAAEEMANAKTDFAGKIAAGAYKPSVGRRIASALAGGLVGFGSRNAAEGISAAQGMRNRPLAEAQRTEAARESGIQSKIDAGGLANQRVQQENAQALQEYNLDERDVRNQGYVTHQNALAEQERANAQAKNNEPIGFTPRDPTNPYLGGTVTTRAQKQIPNSAPPDFWLKNWERDPANKATAEAHAGVAKLKAMQAAGLRLTPEQQAIVASGGKVGPSTRTVINVRENHDGSPVQPRAGRGPAAPQSNISDIVAKATQDKQTFIDGFQRVEKTDANAVAPEGSYIKGTQVLTPQEMHDRIDKFRTDANVKLNKYGAHLDEQGQLQTEPGQPQLTPGAPAAPPPGQRPAAPQPATAPAGPKNPYQQATPQTAQDVNQFPAGSKSGTRMVPIPGGSLAIPESSLPDLMSGKVKIQGNKGESLIFKDGRLVLEQKKRN